MRAIDIIWWSIEFRLTLFWSYVLCAANVYDVRICIFLVEYFWQIIQNNTIERNKMKRFKKKNMQIIHHLWKDHSRVSIPIFFF